VVTGENVSIDIILLLTEWFLKYLKYIAMSMTDSSRWRSWTLWDTPSFHIQVQCVNIECTT